jgi:hypothetical protein
MCRPVVRRVLGLLSIAVGSLGAACSSGGYGAAPVAQPKPASSSPSTDAAAGRGLAITYRPVANAAYLLHRLDSLTLHLPGGLQQQTLERTAYLHLTLADEAAGGYRATIVLDSLRASASAVPISPDSLAPLRGLRWTATVTPAGALSALVADRSTTLGDQLANHLRLLFPVLPAAGARAGAQWGDSTRFPLKADAFDATEQARAAYQAAEDRRSGGLKIESKTTYQRAGTGTQFNQRLEMKASGRRDGAYYLGRNGVLLSAEGRDSGTMTIAVPATGQTVPVDQSGRFEIRAIGR